MTVTRTIEKPASRPSSQGCTGVARSGLTDRPGPVAKIIRKFLSAGGT
jgi:hypothetical protein